MENHESSYDFKNLIAQNKENLINFFLSHCSISKYPAKSNIIHAGDVAESLYYIVDGSVSVLTKDEEGKEIILSYLSKGEFFGEMGFFDKIDERTAWIKTRSVSNIAKISYKKFYQLVQIHPDILMILGNQIARRLQSTTKQVSDLAFLDVTGRVAQTLLKLSEMPDAMTHPEGMQIKVTRRELGLMVGCSRETAGRVLKILENQNLISAKGKTIVVFKTR